MMILDFWQVFVREAEEPVKFADANLKAVVEAELGIADPTPTYVLGLTGIIGAEEQCLGV